MPTLTVRLFDYEGLKARLKGDDRIVVLSCDACARHSDGLGGQAGMDSLADKLLADGFNVISRQLLAVACSADQLNDRLRNQAIGEICRTADVIIPLSCQKGLDRAGQVLPNIPVLTVTRTLGKGTCSPETGARLTEPADGVEIEIEDSEGMSLPEAAKRLGLCSGSF